MQDHAFAFLSNPGIHFSFTAGRLIQSISEKKMSWLLHQLAYHTAGHKKESEFQVWQEGFHPEEIGSPEMLRQKVEYLHYNPVRRGYVTRPEDWQYSSAGQLLRGESGVVEVDALPFI